MMIRERIKIRINDNVENIVMGIKRSKTPAVTIEIVIWVRYKNIGIVSFAKNALFQITVC